MTIEKRDKRAREASLGELRRLRQEGGTRLKYYKTGDEESSEADDPSSIIEEEEDEDGFIEYDNDQHLFEESTAFNPLRTNNRSSSFKFKNPNGGSNAASSSKIDKSILKTDSYFQSIIQQIDQNSDDDDEEDKEHENEQNVKEEKETEKNNGIDINIDDDVAGKDFFEGLLDEDVLQKGLLSHLKEEDFEDPLQPLSSTIDIRADLCKMDLDDLEIDSIEQFLSETQARLNEPTPSVPIQEKGSEVLINAAAAVEETVANDNNEVIRMFWLDAYEKNDGRVFLFGKIKRASEWVSCCLNIGGMERNIFFLPREHHLTTGEPVTMASLHGEIERIADAHGINKFKCKRVLRKYAFELPNIPVEADYLKMVYPYIGSPAIQVTSGETFSHVFGANRSALETLLLKRKIMGPCWLEIPKNAVRQPATRLSWCREEMELVGTGCKVISPVINGPASPDLTVLSLSLRTVLSAREHVHEIVSASGVFYEGVSIEGACSDGSSLAGHRKASSVFTVVRDLENLGFPARFSQSLQTAYQQNAGQKLEIAKNERALLSYLLAMLHRHDPDVLVGHNILGFDLGVLLHRMRAAKIEGWSKIGRLSWAHWPTKSFKGSTEAASYGERMITSGRLICDTLQCSKDIVKAKNYALGTLVEMQLGGKREDWPDVERTVCGHLSGQQSAASDLSKMLKHAELDAYYAASLMFQLLILPLTKQLTCIAGNLWNRTLAGARAERNEYLLLHEFHQLKFICPDKTFSDKQPPPPSIDEDQPDDEPKKSGRRKAAYAGGLVLEPKRGFYDSIVMLLDFNSLYPSIIQEYNICFTTVERDYSSVQAAESMPAIPDRSLEQGILPRILAGLVAKRKVIKNLMKDPRNTPQQQQQYHIRQQAIKLTANSMYGCLGFSHSRFYAKPLAMLITGQGRKILQDTVQLAQSSPLNMDVIYGDTDSIMVRTGTRDVAVVRKLAGQLKRAVNERYRLLEIELDGMFERLLLLKKKKYAALVMEESPPGSGQIVRRLEMKGLDMVRRDWCQLSVDACNLVLDQIMMGEGDCEAAVAAIHAYLEGISLQIRRGGEIPLEKFIISKNLTKDPQQYADPKNQPHVTVALRMRERGQAVRSGDTIEYIVCTGDCGSSVLSERCFAPEELARNPLLQVDGEWYLSQQVHPPVARLCEHVQGTDSARIAVCLGLDGQKYAGTGEAQTERSDPASFTSMALLKRDQRYTNLDPLVLTCINCGHANSLPLSGQSVFTASGSSSSSPLLDCGGCGKRATPMSIYYQVLAAIRRHQTTYNSYQMRCDECHLVTRQMRLYESQCPRSVESGGVEGSSCPGTMVPVYPAQRLYHQLLYYRDLFADGSKKADESFGSVRQLISQTLNQCAFPIINLQAIFAFVNKSK